MVSIGFSRPPSGHSTPATLSPPATPTPTAIAARLSALTNSATANSQLGGSGRQRSGTSPVALSPAASVPSSVATTPRDSRDPVAYAFGIPSPAQPGTPITSRRRRDAKRDATRELQQERAARRAAANLTQHLAEAERRLRIDDEARLRRVEWAARQLNLPALLSQTEAERQRLAAAADPAQRVEVLQRERHAQLLSLVALSNVADAPAPVLARDGSVRGRVSMASSRAKSLVDEAERADRERARKAAEDAKAAADAAAREAKAAAAKKLADDVAQRELARERERQVERQVEREREARIAELRRAPKPATPTRAMSVAVAEPKPSSPPANPLRTRSAEKYVDPEKPAAVAAEPEAVVEAARSPVQAARDVIKRLVGDSSDAMGDSDDEATNETSESVSSMDADEAKRFLPQPGMVRAFGGFDPTFNTGKRGTVTGKAALLLWCQRSTVKYPQCEAPLVTNFTTSWKSGLAFVALVDCHRPGSLQPHDFLSLLESDDDEKRLEAAFAAAELCGVPRLLDAEDLLTMTVPDQLSLITYLSEMYKVFSQH
jgi:hypothetical protein